MNPSRKAGRFVRLSMAVMALALIPLAGALAQARRVSTEALSEDRVAMGSTVTYVEEPAGTRRTVMVTYPADADLALRKISVLSPIGRSLLGRRRGDIVDVALPGDRLLEIHIADTAHRKLLQEAA